MKKKLFIRDLEKRKSASNLIASVPGENLVLPAADPKKFRKPSGDDVKCIAMYAVVSPKEVGDTMKYAPPSPIDVDIMKYAPPSPDIREVTKYAPPSPIDVDIMKYAPPSPDIREVLKYAPPNPSPKPSPNPSPIIARYAPPNPSPKPSPNPSPIIARYAPPSPGVTTLAIGEEGSSPKPRPNCTTLAFGEEGSSPKPGSWKHDNHRPRFWQWFKREG